MHRLVIMVGIPGSGKSTCAIEIANMVGNTIIVSSDDIRNELFGDESIQSDDDKVFALMKERTISALRNGMSVVYDATNVTKRTRKRIIRWAKIWCDDICSMYMNVPVEICKHRNAQRCRKVDECIIDKFDSKLTTPTRDEGFNMCFICDKDGYWSHD